MDLSNHTISSEALNFLFNIICIMRNNEFEHQCSSSVKNG